ncbi:MAG: hypothetical protein PHF84_08460 [bacterium]|nr:hypothetical protein [bacterium]
MRIIINSILIVFLAVSSLFSAFDLGHISARPSGMADSFTALADDASGAFYNPAGISQLLKNELDSTYSLIYPGLDINNLSQMFFSFVLPIRQTFSIGISYAGLSLKDLYAEQVFQLTYSRKLNSFWSIFGKDLGKNEFAIGANVKLLRTGYTVDDTMKLDPLFSGKKNDRTQVTFDAGLLFRIFSSKVNKFYNIGLSLMNITQPDMGLKSEDRVPMVFGLGAGIPLQQYGFMEKIRMDNPVFVLGANYRNKYLNFSAGWENSFFNEILFLRLGTSMLEFTAGLGFRYDLSKNADILLDYAFVLPYKIESTEGKHVITLKFRF